MLLSLLGIKRLTPVSLVGKTVWIIGASSGLGAALAVQLAHDGAIVALSARRKPQLDQVAQALPGAGHLVLPLDVTDAPSFRRAFEQLKKEWRISTPTEQGEARSVGFGEDSPTREAQKKASSIPRCGHVRYGAVLCRFSGFPG